MTKKIKWNQWLMLALAAWLTNAGLGLALNIKSPTYLTLAGAGLHQVQLWLAGLFLCLLLYSQAHRLKLSPSQSLFLAWQLFSLALNLHLLPAGLRLGLFFLNGLSLILAWPILKAAWHQLRGQNLLLAFLSILGTSFSLLRVSLDGLPQELFAFHTEIARLIPFPLFWTFLITALLYAGFRQSREVSSKKLATISLICLLLQLFFIAAIGIGRYLSLSTPTYDFNLFVQMFHSMVKTGQPLTTLERNMPLSHFKVHLSPIYYLMLPIFALFPQGATLQFLQALVVASGLIPFQLLARHFNLSHRLRSILSLVWLAATPLITSNFYDLHENCFLVPLLLWLFWAIEKEKKALIFLLVPAVLLVKEDAALYLWAMALYYGWAKGKVKLALTMFLVSSIYFVGAILYLSHFGDGAMTGRFKSLMSIPAWGLASVPFAVIKNPGFFLSKVFAPGKWIYLLQVLGPLAALPLLVKKLPRYSLILPLLLMNLAVDYSYQYNIRFQYNYGSFSLLLFLLLLYLKDQANHWDNPGSRPNQPQKLALALAISLGIVTSGYHLAAYSYYPLTAVKNHSVYQTMRQNLASIPPEASVLAAPFLTGELAHHQRLYDIEYNVKDGDYFPADYIVFDLRPSFILENQAELLKLFAQDGYRPWHHSDHLLILKKP